MKRLSPRDAVPKPVEFGDYYVAHYELRRHQLRRFRELLSKRPSERLVQAFLEKNPEIVAAFVGTHSVFVFPKPRFGSHYEADFGIAEWNSAGKIWKLVELESPSLKPFIKSGRPSAKLIHAIEQIKEWRRFIRANVDYCQRSRQRNGLGFEELTDRFWGVIVMGRRVDYKSEPSQWRQQLREELQIDLMSYDRFLEWPAEVATRNAGRRNMTHFVIKTGDQTLVDFTLRPFPQRKRTTHGGSQSS